MSKIIFFWLIFHAGLCNNKLSYEYLIFWNVGQGQWVTVVTPDECQHFDFGGDIGYYHQNQNLFLQLCKNKQNALHLSHAHLDHYAFYPIFLRRLAKLCWRELDHVSIPDHRSPKKIPLCPPHIKPKSTQQARLFNPTDFSNVNDSSKVYHFKNVLLPGDSSKRMEKNWVSRIPSQRINYLLLGHHGSRTSTSDLLLKHLPNLKLAVVQSRYKRFKHPHPEVMKRLNKHRIPILKTEDWGNTAIVF